MASIDKLSVRGIRAFSPNDDEQVISFCFPLTIIVGANGCGKTTIIEALKYAVTGTLPPGGAKAGQSFVHDPKSVGSSVVKAAVKLRFTNRAGKRMLLMRSMELTQKKTTMSFKNLDGVISTHDEQGNRQTLSHKCSDMDKQIPQLLGVSKSILESVVFCHQEESSWPLMEASMLKKKFDDIFDSTKYVKALDEIKDQKKKYSSLTREHLAELNLLKGHKHAAQGYRQELTKCNHDLSDLVDEIRDYTTKIKTESKHMEEWSVILAEGDTIQEEIEEMKIDMERDEALMDVHRKNLTEDFTTNCSEHDLQKMLRGSEDGVEDDIKKKEQAEEELEVLKRRISRLGEKKVQFAEDKGLLTGEKKLYEKNLQTRVELMEELASTYGLELSFSQSQSQTQQTNMMSTQQSRFSTASETTMGGGGDGASAFTSGTFGSMIQITAEDLAAFQKSVDHKRGDLATQLQDHRDESQRLEDSVNNELNDLTAKVKTVENDIKGLKTDTQKAKEELKGLSRASRTVRIRKSDIDEARKQAQKYTKMRDDVANDSRLQEIPREIKKKDEEIKVLNSKIDEHKSILKDLRTCGEEQVSIDLLESQVAQDKEIVEEIKTENSALMQKYNIQLATGSLEERQALDEMDVKLGEVKDKVAAAERESEDSSEELKESDSVVSKLTALLNHNKSNLSSLKDQLNQLAGDGRGVQRIKQITRAVRSFEMTTMGDSQVPVDVEPQELLDHFTKRIEELSTQSDQPESVSRIMKKLYNLSKTDDGLYCPCCKKSLRTKEEAQVFQAAMNALASVDESAIIKMDAEKARINTSAKKNYNTWRNSVSNSTTDWSDHKRILDEIEILRASVENDEAKLKAAETKLEEARARNDDAKEDLSDIEQLQDAVRRMRDMLSDISNKKRDISSKQENLSFIAPRATGKDLRTIERQQDEMSEQKDQLQKQISKLNKETSELNNQIQRISSQATKAEKMARDKEDQFAQEQKAHERKNELTEQVNKATEREKKLLDQISPIRQKAKTKELEKDRLRERCKKEEDKRAKLLNKFEMDAEKITSISTAIDSWSTSDKSRRLNKLDAEIGSVEDEIKECTFSLNSLEPELLNLKASVEDREAKKKNIENNLKLLEMTNSWEKLEDEIALLEEKRDKLDISTIRTKAKEARNSISVYEADRSRREGSKDALMAQQREMKRKLQTKEYKDIDERHRVKMIEHETCSLVVSDLDIYYNALDKALLRYHGTKIEGVNKIIKELWALTYRGEDITNIRLTSDQESSSKAKKSYNYRVVMTKGTTELDMRGRCSAGQRVLASIVIRLALAETFCINCGVMALDEPTTNLDYANKKGLAIALAQIIAHRASQDNFQLVIITHDEDFVSMMKNELSAHTGFTMPEKYFQVMREEGSDGIYYSKIHEIDWDDL